MELDKELKEIGKKVKEQIEPSKEFIERLINNLEKYNTKD